MADDTKTDPDEGLDPNVTPADGEDPNKGGDDPDPNVNDGGDEPPTIEAIAADIGWVPRDQFRGDPEKWKPADQFIRDGREIQQSTSRELKALRDTVSNMARTSGALLEQSLADRDAYWLRKRAEAVEANDLEAVDAADKQRQQLREQLPAPTVPPETRDFAAKNPWLGKDILATERAKEVALTYAKNGYDNAAQLAEVEKVMRRERPDLFPAPAKGQAATHRPNSRAAGTSSRGKTFHDLPKEAQDVAKDMAERGVIPNVEAYVAKYPFKEQVR